MPINKTASFRPLEAFHSTWITTEIDAECIDFLENFGFHLCDKTDTTKTFAGRNAMTASQIRNVFGAIKQIEARGENTNWRTKFLMLRPKMAYASARVLTNSRDSRIKAFREVFENAHAAVGNNWDNFERFSQVMEGIVAYHKVEGGKD